jgi:cell division protein FtsW (lipid II flippase)
MTFFYLLGVLIVATAFIAMYYDSGEITTYDMLIMIFAMSLSWFSILILIIAFIITLLLIIKPPRKYNKVIWKKKKRE